MPIREQISDICRVCTNISFFSAAVKLQKRGEHVYDILQHTPNHAFSASSNLNAQTRPFLSRYNNPHGGVSQAAWYANVQAPNQWIQVNFGIAKFFNEVVMAPSHVKDPPEYVKTGTLHCGLDGFVVLPFGTVHMLQPKKYFFMFGLHYCRTVRLVVFDWKTNIAMRWEILQASGKKH